MGGQAGDRSFVLEPANFGKQWLNSRLVALSRQAGKNQEPSENELVFCQICVSRR